MASDTVEFDKNIENLKNTVRKSFAHVYATLKARELKTLRQLDAIRKQCQDDKDLKGNCVQNIHISYENESTLLDNINSYGQIDFEKLNFDSSTFILEDYVSPNHDHMYSYKTIEELTKEEDSERLKAIEEAALKQVTASEDCVCYVNIQTEDVSKQFRDLNISLVKDQCEVFETVEINEVENQENVMEDEKSDCSDIEIKKINPTDHWLNSIKDQTETEPTHVMEHSTIACS